MGDQRVRLEVLARVPACENGGKDATGEPVVIVFPWAGGNLAHPAVRSLAKALAKRGAATLGVSLPGRLARASEPAFRSFQELIPQVAQVLRGHFAQQRRAPSSIVFFGYSLGCQVAWQVLESLGDFTAAPIKLVMAAARAPQNMAENLPKVHDMSDAAFLDYISAKGGTPKEVLSHPSFRALIIPPLRADYELLGTFRLDNRTLPKFDSSVTLQVLHGDDLQPSEVEPWQSLLASPEISWLGVDFFPEGGHFFLFTNVDRVADILARTSSVPSTNGSLHKA